MRPTWTGVPTAVKVPERLGLRWLALICSNPTYSIPVQALLLLQGIQVYPLRHLVLLLAANYRSLPTLFTNQPVSLVQREGKDEPGGAPRAAYVVRYVPN